MRLPEGYELSLHVKLSRDLSLEEAHDVVEGLEQEIRAEVPELGTIHTHIEPLSRTDWARAPTPDDTATEREAIESAVRRYTGSAPLDVTFRDGEQGRVALVTVEPAGRAAASLGAPQRGRDRGGRARALSGPGRRDRAHRADGRGSPRRAVAVQRRHCQGEGPSLDQAPYGGPRQDSRCPQCLVDET